MKILQVISGLGNGGAEKFVVELSNALSVKHKVKICSFKAVEDHFGFPQSLKAEVTLKTFGKTKGFDPSLYAQLYSLIKEERPDVVHFHLDATIKYVLPLLLFFKRIRFVYTIHSSLNVHKQNIFSQLRYFPFLTKRVCWVCIAPGIYEEFQKAFPFLKFESVENGISDIQTSNAVTEAEKEISTLKKTDSTTVLIAVGKLDVNKNQVLLMDAMKELLSYDVIAIVLGNDPSKEQTALRKLQAMNAENMFLLGPKSNVADYMACSDAFVMTSLHEGLPISALESFSSGLPVITTPAGGMKNLVSEGQNGFVTKDFEKKSLLEAIKNFLGLSEEQRKTISKNNRDAFVSQYHIDTCAAKYLALYH